ncbi:MAG: CoA ester lyase [Beijerinckiaceae bacterium]|nr:CoA ester lyase [Beijerinckiaceae bacterium]
MRSLLFTPANSARKIEKALASSADAVILDLEDSIAPGAKDDARRGAREALSAQGAGARIIVRVNGLASGELDADLEAIAPLAPFAIMLPKSSGGDDVQHLSVKLAVHEAACGLADGAIGVLPIATESADALFRLATYKGASARLAGLAWSAEDLAADIGAMTNRLPGGEWTGPFALARNLALFAASAAGVPAIDAVLTDFRDLQSLRRECAQARRDGFSGKLAIHPDQVAIINETFTPSDDEGARARRIVAAFAASPQSGALALDGAMIDAAHLAWARRVLARLG